MAETPGTGLNTGMFAPWTSNNTGTLAAALFRIYQTNARFLRLRYTLRLLLIRPVNNLVDVADVESVLKPTGSTCTHFCGCGRGCNAEIGNKTTPRTLTPNTHIDHNTCIPVTSSSFNRAKLSPESIWNKGRFSREVAPDLTKDPIQLHHCHCRSITASESHISQVWFSHLTAWACQEADYLS